MILYDYDNECPMVGYGYKDYNIVSAEISTIEHRSECCPYYEDGMLPLFASPMSTVVSMNNYSKFKDNHIEPILPRTTPYVNRIECIESGDWTALSKDEFIKMFVTERGSALSRHKSDTFRICIDTAKGNLKSLYLACNEAKMIAAAEGYKLIIMTGNIDNPMTYAWICKYSNVDYVRLSVGSGDACLTASNTGVHYGIASLIHKCKEIKMDQECPESGSCKPCPAIVADGGIRGFRDINVALALGADYVMIGSLFAALQESAAETVNIDGKMYKRYFGMSTREAQKLINEAKENPSKELTLKTSEGKTKYLELGTSIDRWVRNVTDYIKSAMSYVDARTIQEFIDNTDLIQTSPCERAAINK